MTADGEKKSPTDDSPFITELKSSLKRATFHEERRPDGIIVYCFDNLSRQVLIQWIDWIRAAQGKLKSPLRILYDFRGSGPPSRFVTDRLPGLMAELEIPEDTRSAFLVDDNLNGRFTRRALEALPANVGQMQSFVNLSPAIKWLQEEVDHD